MTAALKEVPCPDYIETLELLRAAEQAAKEGEFFSAGCWWAHATEALARLRQSDPAAHHGAQQLVGEACERLSALEREARAACQGPALQGVRGTARPQPSAADGMDR